MNELNFFQSVNFLEPKCTNCEEALDYGSNTRYEEKENTHICLNCGTPIR